MGHGIVVDAFTGVLGVFGPLYGRLPKPPMDLLDDIFGGGHPPSPDPKTFLNPDPSKVPKLTITPLGPEPAAPPPKIQSPAPVQTAPDNIDGAFGDALKATQDAQNKASSEFAAADDKLVAALLQANSKSDAGKARLRELQQQIVEQVKQNGPPPWSPAVETQMAEFLRGKIGQIQTVIAQADLDDKSIEAIQNALADDFKATHPGKTDPGKTDPGKTDPGKTDPGKTDPGKTDPGKTDPGGQGDPNPGNQGQPDPGDLGGLGDPGDNLGGLGADMIPQMMAPLQSGLGELAGLPGQMAGMGTGMIPGFGGGGFGGPGGFDPGLHDPGLHDPGLRDPGQNNSAPDPDPNQKPDPLTDPSLGADPNKPDQPTDPKPDPPADPGAQPGSSTGQTPVGAAPAAGVDPKAASTAVTMPNSTEIRQAPTPQIAQAVRNVIAGDDVNTAFNKAHLDLPTPATIGNAAVDQDKITLGTVAISRNPQEEVVAMSNNDVLVGGNLVPIAQFKPSPDFVAWVNPTPAAAPSAPAPAPPPPPQPTPVERTPSPDG